MSIGPNNHIRHPFARPRCTHVGRVYFGHWSRRYRYTRVTCAQCGQVLEERDTRR